MVPPQLIRAHNLISLSFCYYYYYYDDDDDDDDYYYYVLSTNY